MLHLLPSVAVATMIARLVQFAGFLIGLFSYLCSHLIAFLDWNRQLLPDDLIINILVGVKHFYFLQEGGCLLRNVIVLFNIHSS